jgi:REP element-mobilizing transposase RayT
MMVHGYHLIMSFYGFRLPNDPRGSWSDFVGAWELLRFGKTERKIDEAVRLTREQRRQLDEARACLKYPPVTLTGRQALSVGTGFGSLCAKSRFAIWACAILPEHVHLVITRHRYCIEQTANLLKGAATSQLRTDGLDPMANYGTSRSPWARGQWSVFLDSEESIDNAIHYVEQNPNREGKPRQRWSFVSPFSGIEDGGVVIYY